MRDYGFWVAASQQKPVLLCLLKWKFSFKENSSRERNFNFVGRFGYLWGHLYSKKSDGNLIQVNN